jgi:hypothetical protein
MRRKPITSADEYANWAKEAEYRWFERVAVEPNVWNEILDRFPDLAGQVAQNDNLPDDTLVRLSRWPFACVRQHLARRERLPRMAIESLKLDICDGVRRFLSSASLTANDLVELMDGDQRVAVSEPYLADDAPYYLKLRFAIDWREHVDSPRPERRTPYEDPARMAEVLQEAGYGNLEPLDPLPGKGWPEACEAFDDACVWLAYGGFTGEELFAELASADGWESPEAAANSPHCPSAKDSCSACIRLGRRCPVSRCIEPPNRPSDAGVLGIRRRFRIERRCQSGARSEVWRTAGEDSGREASGS